MEVDCDRFAAFSKMYVCNTNHFQAHPPKSLVSIKNPPKSDF